MSLLYVWRYRLLRYSFHLFALYLAKCSWGNDDVEQVAPVRLVRVPSNRSRRNVRILKFSCTCILSASWRLGNIAATIWNCNYSCLRHSCRFKPNLRDSKGPSQFKWEENQPTWTARYKKCRWMLCRLYFEHRNQNLCSYFFYVVLCRLVLETVYCLIKGEAEFRPTLVT